MGPAMSYIVLARKFRPQSFKEIVGQEPVAQTLVNAIEAGRVAHAYIFSGPRGIGKTTVARILAKCLNCQKGVTITPCNKCPSCTSISQGNSIEDVLEIDGASNRGIEQIRELRDSAKYTPSSSRYRIYIIDEAHQITKDAFGALLKILEEPPAHVIFMMATTEAQKIPAPILSRCQRFSLKPISPDKLLAHLKKICDHEKIKAEEGALSDIVRFVEGSLRDALSLLDQAIVYADKGITSQTLRDLLGLLPRDTIREFAKKLTLSDPVPILNTVHQLLNDGIDLTQLGRDLQSYYHELMLAKAGVEDPLNKEYRLLKDEAAAYDFSTLERNIRLLSRMIDEMRRSEAPRAVFEIYALRIAQKVLNTRDLVERLEKLESRPAPAPSIVPNIRPLESPHGAPHREIPKPHQPNPMMKTAAPIHTPATPTPNTIPPKPQATVITEEKMSPANQNTQAQDEAAVDVSSFWPQLLTDIGKEKHALASALEDADVSLTNSTLHLAFGKAFSRDMVQRSNGYLKSVLASHLGREVQITMTVTPPNPNAKAPPAAAPTIGQGHSLSSGAESATEPTGRPERKVYHEIPHDQVGEDIQRVLKHFPGVVKKEHHE